MQIRECFTVSVLIVSVTKFSIVIGSSRAYVSRRLARDHVGVQFQLFNYNFLYLDTCNWTPVPLCTHASVTCTLMGSVAVSLLFPKLLKCTSVLFYLLSSQRFINNAI